MSDTQTKHRPGPWSLREDRQEIDVLGPDMKFGDSVATVWLNPSRGGKAEMAANAHLVAAAPDLRESLERLVAVVMLAGIPDPEARLAADRALREASAALAKARGEP